MELLSKLNSHIFSTFAKISYPSLVQLVLFKILEYSRECKIPNSKIPNSTYCITQDRQSGIVFCHSWPTPILWCFSRRNLTSFLPLSSIMLMFATKASGLVLYRTIKVASTCLKRWMPTVLSMALSDAILFAIALSRMVLLNASTGSSLKALLACFLRRIYLASFGGRLSIPLSTSLIAVRPPLCAV